MCVGGGWGVGRGEDVKEDRKEERKGIGGMLNNQCNILAEEHEKGYEMNDPHSVSHLQVAIHSIDTGQFQWLTTQEVPTVTRQKESHILQYLEHHHAAMCQPLTAYCWNN